MTRHNQAPHVKGHDFRFDFVRPESNEPGHDPTEGGDTGQPPVPETAPTRRGGVRPGAGRPARAIRPIKRSITLSPAADARVRAAQQAHETYSMALERVLQSVRPWQFHPTALPTPVVLLLSVLRPERERVAVVYHRLRWTRQAFEQVVQHYGTDLAGLGMRLYVATKDVAFGRKEGYITVDGKRYSAMSLDEDRIR